MQISWRFAKNAAANLGRGSAGAIVALLLPPVLVRHMPVSSYAVWVLILQVAAYTSYLDFGLQTAVGRYVAFANEKKDPMWRDGIFSTAFAGLVFASVIGSLLTLTIAAASRRIFPSVPPDLLSPMRLAMVIVGISAALGLPASAWNGVFVGLQRYEVPAITTTIGKLLSGVGLIAAAISGQSLVSMAVVVALANLFSYSLQFGMLRRVAPEIHFRQHLVTGQMIRELSGYSLSLTIWSVSTLLVSGFDLVLVGRFQFSAVTPYSVCATLVIFLGGAQNAILGLIMPHAAELHARQDAEALGSLLMKATQLGMLLLLVTGMPLMIFAGPIIKLWSGAQYADTGRGILVVLILANIVRLIGAPYASILIGTGQQRLVTVSPLLEGGSNLVASIILGTKYGAMGVAEGTLIGAVIGILAHVFYNIPRTSREIRANRGQLLWSAVSLPVLATAPLAVLVIRTSKGLPPSPLLFASALAATGLLCIAIALDAYGWKQFKL